MHGFACRSEDIPNVFGEEPDISHHNTDMQSDMKNQVRFSDDVPLQTKSQIDKSRYSENTYNDIGSRNYINVRSQKSKSVASDDSGFVASQDHYVYNNMEQLGGNYGAFNK